MAAPTGATSGSGTGSILVGETATIVTDRVCPHNEDRSIVVRVLSSINLRLSYMFSPNGTDWYVGKQTAHSIIAEDGSPATYTKLTVLETPVGYRYKVQVLATLQSADYAYDFREYISSQT